MEDIRPSEALTTPICRTYSSMYSEYCIEYIESATVHARARSIAVEK